MNQNLEISPINFILFASVTTEIVPVFFYLYFDKKKDKSLRVIFLLLIANFITDIYSLYKLFKLDTNFVVFNIYLLIETFCLFLFYRNIIEEKKVKKVLSFIISAFVIFWVYAFANLGQKQFLYNCAAFENIFILAFAIYYYYDQIIKVNSPFIYMQTRFWVVSAYLVYIAGTFFLLLYIPSLNSKDQVRFYILNYVFVIIRTILISIAMFMKDNSEKTKFKPIQSRF